MKKLADMDLTIVVVAFLVISLILTIGGIIPQPLIEGVELPLIGVPSLYIYSLLAGLGVFIASFLIRIYAKIRYLNWKRIAVLSLLIPVLVVHAYPLMASPRIVLHVATPTGEIDLPGNGRIDGQWVYAKILLTNRMTKGVAKYSVNLVDGGGTPYALIDGKGSLTPQPQLLASKVNDVPVKARAPDGCYKISMSVDVLAGETTFYINDYVGRTCVRGGYLQGAVGLPAETRIVGPAMNPFAEAWNLMATAVTLATFVLTVWKGEVKGKDLFLMTLVFLGIMIMVIMR